jgi:hypothetical protein
MQYNLDTPRSAIIYEFPVKTRLNANKLAEQARYMREIEAARSAPVAATSAWYHDEAMAAEPPRGRGRRQ